VGQQLKSFKHDAQPHGKDTAWMTHMKPSNRYITLRRTKPAIKYEDPEMAHLGIRFIYFAHEYYKYMITAGKSDIATREL
jgi:hypothetical protein